MNMTINAKLQSKATKIYYLTFAYHTSFSFTRKFHFIHTLMDLLKLNVFMITVYWIIAHMDKRKPKVRI